MVRTEFLSTIKRLKNLGYRIIYISKELKTEINLKNGAKITSYGPNMADKVANVLAGTVTLTVRAFMNNRGRFLQLAKEENIFGGGRFNFVNDTCPLDMDAFIEELKLAQGGETSKNKPKTRQNEPEEATEENIKAPEEVPQNEPEQPQEEEKPKTRRRKAEIPEEVQPEAGERAEKAITRRRKRREE